jgi:hypothetical protein
LNNNTAKKTREKGAPNIFCLTLCYQSDGGPKITDLETSVVLLKKKNVCNVDILA